MKIALSNNRADLGKIPANDTAAWNTFNGSFFNTDVEPIELMHKVQLGYAYTAQHRNYRHSKNFICAQHIGLDFDTEDERSTISALSADPFFSRYAAFIHTTPSHRPEAPRARVVFVLDKPVTDKDKYAELAQALVHRFNMADGACKDAARFFYGAKSCETKWLGNALSLTDAAIELIFPFRKHKQEAATKAAEAAENRVIVASGDVPEQLLRAHSESLLSRVRNAPDGEKYVTLRDMSITFGGYVGGGYYSRADVSNWLRGAIRQNAGRVEDFRHADKTIEESLLYGMNRPLHFEVRDNQPSPQAAVPELDQVHPPLSEAQRIQVTAVIRDREWKAFHDGMTAAQRQKWQQHFPDAILDMYQLGYCERRIDSDTGEILSKDALTVPYRNAAGETINVEYRNGRISYEVDRPALFLTDLERNNHPALLVPDSMTAIKTYLHLGMTERRGDPLNIIGLPKLPLDDESVQAIGSEDITVLLEPETTGKGLRKLKGHARFVRLPLPLEKMIRYGMTSGGLERTINQARMWS
jgi:hypothetical protein